MAWGSAYEQLRNEPSIRRVLVLSRKNNIILESWQQKGPDGDLEREAEFALALSDLYSSSFAQDAEFVRIRSRDYHFIICGDASFILVGIKAV